MCIRDSHVEARVHERAGQSLGVGDHLLLILHVAGFHGFLESHGFGRDDVHQRTALEARENRLVHRRRELLLAKDQSAARAAQRFVRGGGCLLYTSRCV